jgi:methionyl-tRNA formyltransferase
MNPLQRIVFLGSSAFAVPVLKGLVLSERFLPVYVITQPDRPSGRSQKLAPTPVKTFAIEQNLPIYQPEDINSPEALSFLQEIKPDLLITVAYGQKLKKAVRNSAPMGAINLHPSLLPELRGAAPIPFAVWNGMIMSGLSIFKLTSRMDAGPVYFSKQLFIFPSENATELSERLAYIGSKCLVQFLTEWSEHDIEPIPQDEEKATYSRKLEREDMLLDWQQPAADIWNHIRALSISPGAYTTFRGEQLKILAADVLEEASSELAPGSVVRLEKNEGFVVQAADKQLLIRLVQPAGKKIMSAWAYHLGAHVKAGERLE